MNYVLLGLILFWSVFWLAYAVFTLNNETFFVRYRKSYSKQERPILFHAEVLVSFAWSLSGYAALYVFLSHSI